VRYARGVRLLRVLVVLACASAALAVEPAATRNTKVQVSEDCSFRLLGGRGVALTTTMTVSNAGGGRSASVRLIPGWNVGRLYPKGEFPLFVRLNPGATVRRTMTRRVLDAPRLWEMLRVGAGLGCASTYTVRIPARPPGAVGP
jgi:hypothetical protein